MSDDDDFDSKIDEVIGNLTEREREILKRRFGIDLSGQKSLHELGEDFKITREKIREFERIALEKLNDPNRGPDDAA